MLLIRFGETFRDRIIEWGLSLSLIIWGIVCLAQPGIFNEHPAFIPLLQLVSQAAWGIIAIVTGFIRIVFLTINGAWRPSAHIRAIGCVLGIVIWGSILLATFSLIPYVAPMSVMYGMALVFDTFALWFASEDAKLSDICARKRVGA